MGEFDLIARFFKRPAQRQPVGAHRYRSRQGGTGTAIVGFLHRTLDCAIEQTTRIRKAVHGRTDQILQIMP
jgi:hypothetical protein